MSWTFEPHPDDAARPAPPVVESVDAESSPSRPWLRRETLVIRPRADTRDAVVLELLPLAAPVLAYGATQAFIPWGPMVVGVSILIAALAAMVFALRDGSTLASRGFARRPFFALALVSPILYLAVRGRMLVSIDKSAYNPLPWAIAATVVAALALWGLNGFESATALDIGDLGSLTGLLG